MDLRSARYFQAVAETGSLRKAADRLRIASSAISRQISILEEELGTPLFERVARGMVLTGAGEIYLDFVRSMLVETERVRTQLDALKGLRRGHIRIVTIEGVVSDFVIDAVVAFQHRYPGVTFGLMVVGSDSVKKIVAARQAEVGIAINSAPEEGIEISFRIADPLLAVMVAVHPLARERGLRLADILGNYPIGVPEIGFGLRTQIEDYCRSIHRPLGTLALVTNSICALRSFVRLGGGITFLPSLALREDVMRGGITALPLLDLKSPTTIDLCVPQGRPLSAPAAEFLDHLKAEAERALRDRPVPSRWAR